MNAPIEVSPVFAGLVLMLVGYLATLVGYIWGYDKGHDDGERGQ